MNKTKVLQVTASVELMVGIVIFAITYWMGNYSLTYSIVFTLVLSMISGVSMYVYLCRAYGLDLKPWRN